MTVTEIARLIGYAAAVAAGLFCVVYGAWTDNPELLAAGLGLVSTGGLAAVNVNSTGKHS